MPRLPGESAKTSDDEGGPLQRENQLVSLSASCLPYSDHLCMVDDEKRSKLKKRGAERIKIAHAKTVKKRKHNDVQPRICVTHISTQDEEESAMKVEPDHCAINLSISVRPMTSAFEKW